MPQIWIDDDAKRILDKEKETLIATGRPGATLADAIRSQNLRAYIAEAQVRTFRELKKIEDEREAENARHRY